VCCACEADGAGCSDADAGGVLGGVVPVRDGDEWYGRELCPAESKGLYGVGAAGFVAPAIVPCVELMFSSGEVRVDGALWTGFSGVAVEGGVEGESAESNGL
jgi:hypothetical protein